MKPLKDYSFIKGVNYDMKEDALVERDLGYARRIGLNSVRIWLIYELYEKEPEKYVMDLKKYIQCCDRCGFTVQPIFFNGNGLNPNKLEEEFWPKGEKYVKDIVEAIQDEPGLIMYDIMNEPSCNEYIDKSPKEEKEARLEKLGKFVRHFCEYTKSIDPVNAITVGHHITPELEMSADLVDVISYHNYSETVAGIRKAAEEALAVSEKYKKPLINNEMSCIARANPYDLTIQIMDEYHIPWYTFNLMIEGYWKDVHGIFYTDGTVRDPAVAAAIMGCYRNRDIKTIVPEKPDREMHAVRALERLKKQLGDHNEDVFHYQGNSVSEILDICEEMANLLEGGQLTDMRVPPTAYIYKWRKEENPDYLEVRKFAYNLALELKEKCQIL